MSKRTTPKRNRQARRQKLSYGLLALGQGVPKFKPPSAAVAEERLPFPSAFTREEFLSEAGLHSGKTDGELLKLAGGAIVALLERRSPVARDLAGLALQEIAYASHQEEMGKVALFLRRVSEGAMAALSGRDDALAMDILYRETVAAVERLQEKARRNGELRRVARENFYWPALIANKASITPLSKGGNSANERTLRELGVGTESGYKLQSQDRKKGKSWSLEVTSGKWAYAVREHLRALSLFVQRAQQSSGGDVLLKAMQPWIRKCGRLSNDAPVALWQECSKRLIRSLWDSDREALLSDFHNIVKHRDNAGFPNVSKKDRPPKRAYPSDLLAAITGVINRSLTSLLHTQKRN